MALALIGSCAALTLRGSFEQADLAWQTFALRLRADAGLDPPRARIAIVAYDQATDAALGGVWDRGATARLVDALRRAGARLVVIDRLYEDNRPGTAALAAALRRAGNVVLGQEVVVADSAFGTALTLAALEPRLAAAARATGIVNLPPAGADARFRAYNTDVALDSAGHTSPALALAAARALGVHPRIGGPTFLINFAGRAGRAFPLYSLAHVLDGRQNLSGLAGAVALVGDQVAANKDTFATPVDAASMMYGVELHAHALNTLLLGNPLTRPDPPWQVALTFPAAALAAGWALRRRLLSSVAVAVALIALTLAGALAALLLWRVWLDVSGPLLATLLAPLGVLGVRLGTEERANRELRSLFGRYVAPGVVARIVEDPDAFGLAGELREITVLFSDIRNFTTLSEGMAPHDIVRMLSRYFAAMVEEVQAQGGTVDKYVGDAIMALFGAPDDQPDAPARAVRAALAMQRRLAAVNAEFAMAGYPTIAAGIGLHHGPAAVGVMGAPSKREYSAVGDTVNTASRLEGLTKTAGYAVVASAAVVAALPAALVAQVAPHDLGEMEVKGRAASVRVYGLGPPLGGPGA